MIRRFVPALILTLLPTLAGAASVPPETFSDLQWRLVGPLRAGWGTCASGVPGEPETFYFGAADGGVWKTRDAGRTWNPLFQDQDSASIGDLGVARGNPKILYVGTGQVTTRWDVVSGTGVYRSNDGGQTWERRGLAETRHIGRLWIDPRNPDVVLVAALGHIFGPNPERGVFRTEDGGKSWRKVLFVNEDSGAVDLAVDSMAPDTVFASTWQMRHYPWQAYFTPGVGPGSGIFKSLDGGRTWTRLTDGLPTVPLGRIGLAAAPGSGGQRVYATIDAGKESGVYRTDDGGAHWRRVNSTASLAGAYFASLVVHPKNPDTVYVMGQSIRVSTDGGTTFTFLRGAPGGDDYHYLWIDPEQPERMITAADQGTVITVNGGASWSSWYNQPTGQFYHVATDDRFPYWIYSGQQDSGTVAVASRSDYGQLTFRDWHPVGGDERDYDIPFPGDPDVVFGSGLGGKVTRWDARTGQVRNVSPWPVSSYGQRPTTVRYRTTWITPMAISKVPPHAIYLGMQVLFRSTNQGETWETISPDLTGAVPGKAKDAECGGNVAVEKARACGYGVISTIAPSPLEKDLVWVGMDDGLIQLTRDGGKTWNDVTPKEVADWGRVAQIDASAVSPGTAYAAVDRHRLDDLRPYAFVTHDYGKTWRAINAGLPQDAYVLVVRQDPVKPELLFAGTRRGVYASLDDGAGWQPLQLNLPTSGVNDLTIHGNDLIAATEGRAIWALDDYTPLRHAGSQPGLLPPAMAYRLGANQNRDTPLPLDEPRTFNPPTGAVIDYILPAAVKEPVTLEIVDGQGRTVRRFASDETPKRAGAGQYFDDDWLQPLEPLPARPGHNRFVWNLRTERPRALDYDYSIAAVPGADTPEVPQGMFVLPGQYEVRLTVGGRTQSQPLTVALDPRVHISAADLAAQRGFYDAVSKALEEATEAQERSPKEGIATAAAVLSALATDLEACDCTPTAPQKEVFETYRKQLDDLYEENHP